MSPTPKTKQNAIAATISTTSTNARFRPEASAIAASVFDALPASAFIRESQLVQSRKRPGVPVPLPFSAPTLWRKVKEGTFPKPIKLSARVTAWNVGDVRAWINEQTAMV